MQRRATAEIVAANVTATMESRHVTPETLSAATGIPLPTLRERLANLSPFTFGEVTDVSGFFSLSPDSLFAGGTQ